MKWRLFLLLQFLSITASSYAGPPRSPAQLAPGILVQDIRARNLGPLVHSTTARFGEVPSAGFTSVQWYNADGTKRRELSGALVHVNSGFVSEGPVYHGIFEDWKIELTNKGSLPGSVNATPDSRVFHHNYRPEHNANSRTIAVDVYLNGNLMGTIGPYSAYRGENARLSASGNSGLLVRESDEGPLKIIVFDDHAKLQFETKCDDQVMRPIVTANSDGALVEANTGEQPQRFMLYTAQGKTREMKIGPNARFLTWVADTHQSVFETSVGYTNRYRLIDWDKGETIWEIPDPCPRTNAVGRGVTAVANYVITCGYEYTGEEHPVTIPTLYALDSASGTLAAKWKPNMGLIVSLDGGRLFPLKGKVYFVTDNLVHEISVDDIVQKRNGWE